MIKRLLILNGLAILGALIFHAAGWGYTAMFWWTDRYLPVSVPDFSQFGGFEYYSLRLLEQLVGFSVPAFLLVSGFFVAFAAGKNRPTVGWEIVFNRLKGLIPPFLLWSGVIVLFSWLQGKAWSPAKLIVDVVTGQVSPPYYYIPVLVQLYLLSPLLVWLAKKNWKWLLVCAGALQALVMILRYHMILGWHQPVLDRLLILARSWLFPAYGFWFCLGIVIAFHLPGFKDWVRKVRWLALGGAVLLFFAGIIEWELLLRRSGEVWIGTSETLVDNFYIVCFLLAYLGFESFAPPRPALFSQLGTRSYGIYLTHLLVMEVTARLIYHIAPGILSVIGLYIPVLLVVGLAVPLAMMELMNRLPVRRYYEYVFG